MSKFLLLSDFLYPLRAAGGCGCCWLKPNRKSPDRLFLHAKNTVNHHHRSDVKTHKLQRPDNFCRFVSYLNLLCCIGPPQSYFDTLIGHYFFLFSPLDGHTTVTGIERWNEDYFVIDIHRLQCDYFAVVCKWIFCIEQTMGYGQAKPAYKCDSNGGIR